MTDEMTAPTAEEAVEEQRLFPEEPTDEKVWHASHTVMGTTIELRVWRSLIAQEMIDQCDIKSSHRKAILRRTEKALVRAVKVGFDKLNEKQVEQNRWNAFIVMVDRTLGNSHLKVRNDESLIDGLIESSPTLAPSS